MPTPAKQGHEECATSAGTYPARVEKSKKRDVVVPHLFWYPDYRSTDCGEELKALLVKTGLDDIYSRIDWKWHPASYIEHFLRKARFVYGGVDVIQERFIEYTPRGCSTPIHITMEKMAKCLGLDLDGLFFDSASADEVYKETYFGPMKKIPLKGEYYFDMTAAATEAVKSVGRFAVNVIYLREASSWQVSLECMKHLQCALAGEPVAWGKVLWEQLLRCITGYQTQWQPMKTNCIRRTHFSALLLAILLGIEYAHNNPDLKVWWSVFKSTKRAENQIGSRSDPTMAKLVENDQDSDGAVDENRGGIKAKSCGLMQDMKARESYYRRSRTEKATVDHLANLANQDQEIKRGIYNCPQPRRRRPSEQDEDLKVQNPKVSHLQGESVIVGRNYDPHGKLKCTVSKRFHGQKEVRVPATYHEDSRMRVRTENELEVMGGACTDSTFNSKFEAWQQVRHERYSGMELRLDENQLSPVEICQQELDPMDNQIRTSPLTDKSQSGEFHRFLRAMLLDSETVASTSADETVDNNVPQLTRNLLQSFDGGIEKKQDVNQDVGPSGPNRLNQTLHEFASLDSSLKKSAETTGTDLETSIQSPRVPIVDMMSNDEKVISNLLEEQEKLIMRLTEKATELKQYLGSQKRKFGTMSDTVEQKDSETDLSEAELKLERAKTLELEQSIKDLRRQTNVMEQELTLYKTIAEQLQEQKEMVANLTNENSALKRKLESKENAAGDLTEKAETTENALRPFANVFKKFKMYF